MSPSRTLLASCLVLAAGCGGGDSSGTNNVNPYANQSGEQNSAPLPTPTAGRPARSGNPNQSGGTVTNAVTPIPVPQPGYSAEMGVPLSFVEYLRFARQSWELLGEMTQIHAEVSESGDAEPHQVRWGELTAAHSKLVRDVVGSAYPTTELARDLRQTGLPKLNAALKQAADVMTEFDDVEGGLAQPYDESQQIFNHLAKNLTPSELATMPSVSSAPNGDANAATASTRTPSSTNPFQSTTPPSNSVSEASRRDVNNLSVDRSSRGNWRVSVDAATETLSLAKDARLGIRVPGSPTPLDAGVLYPLTPGPYVLLGVNTAANETSEIWDLEARRKIGSIKGLTLGSSHVQALRGDGKYFAAQPHQQSLVGVWDVDADKSVGTLPVKDWTGLDFLGFAKGSRLVCVDGDDLLVAVLPDLRQERRVTLPARRSETSYALSPGGRFLAFHADNAVQIYDLTIAQVAGTVPLDKGVKGVAFSAEGTELAALYDDPFNECGIAVWDVASGRQKSEIVFDRELGDLIEPNTSYRGRPLEWFPGGDLLFMAGCGVVDRHTGDLLLTLPAKVNYPVKPIHPRQLGVVKGVVFEAFNLTDDQIKTARAVASAGGKAVDAYLPPLSAADRSQVRSVIVLKGTDVAWTVSPDRLGGGQMEVKAKSSLSIPNGQIYRGALSSPQAGRIALMYSGVPIRTRTSSGWGLAPTQTPVRIDLYDTVRSRKLSSYELPFTTTLESLSPNGSWAVTRIADGMDRLDVWNVDDEQHVCAFRPYNHLGEDSRDRDVRAAAFVDDGHVLTMNNRSITLWEVPACRAVYEISLEGVGQPVVSPSRKFFALLDGPSRACQIFDSLTGAQVGAVDCGRQPSGCGFHPNGERLAVLIGNQTGGEVLIVGMADGEVIDRFPVARSGSLVQWMGDEHLLVGGEQRLRQNSYLINLPKQMVVWNYTLSFGMPIWDSSDGRHWYMAAANRNARTFAVNGVRLPESRVADYVADHATPPDLILQPGGGIDVLVNVQDPSGESDLAARVKQNIIAKYREAGVNILDGHSLVLSITGSSGSTGRTMRFGSLIDDDDDSESVSVSEREASWDVTVTSDGVTVWENHLRYSSAGSVVWMNEIEEDDEEDLSTEAENQMWRNAVAGLLNYDPPVYVFPANEQDGLGGSQLTPRGPVIATPLQPRQ